MTDEQAQVALAAAFPGWEWGIAEEPGGFRVRLVWEGPASQCVEVSAYGAQRETAFSAAVAAAREALASVKEGE